MRLERKDPQDGPAQGLLRAEHFQTAYATTDIAAARRLFEALGIRAWSRLEGATPAGGHIRTDLAWVGPLMYELIEASGPGSELYMDRLPTDGGFHLRHHHLGYLVTAAEWEETLAAADAQGWPVPYRNANSLLDCCFVAVPGLPHLLEYLRPQPAGLDFFAGVPRH